MKEIILETLHHSSHLIPFLFIAFLIIEFIEHKISKKNRKIIEKSGKLGPIFGSLFGLFPQCGFSVLATNLYITKIITLGTLIAIYLSTSDEMLPILLSRKVPISLIITILAIKFIIGVVAGFIIDLIYKKGRKIITKKEYDLCEHDHCHCEEGSIFKAAFIHTIKIFVFILGVNLVFNICFEYLGKDYLSKLFLKDSLFGPFITSLVGLIPNCGASVVITELYLKNAISFGSMISGLLTGSGIAILVLFKSNKDMKENFKIISSVYLIGVLSGIIIDLIISIF